MKKLLEVWRSYGSPGSEDDVCEWAAEIIEALKCDIKRMRYFAAGRGAVSEADDDVEISLLVHGLRDKIHRLISENRRLTDAWFIDETVCPDGSLRPSISDTLERMEALEIENADLRKRVDDWTPCELANPTKAGWYIVTPYRGKEAVFAYYSASTGIWDTTFRVLAWRKKPDIYKETIDE